MISFLNLKYFLFLSEELNFNSASQKLHITQQSLSGHIKKMEDHFGVQLFQYGPPLMITPAGLLLKEHAYAILDREKKLEADMLEVKTSKRGTINIGSTYARSQFLLPPIISKFEKKYPLVKVNLYEGNTPDVERALSKGNVDVTVGFKPDLLKGIISLPLYYDSFMLVVHPSVLEKSFPDRKRISFRYDSEKNVKDIIQRCPFLTMPPNTTVGKVGAAYINALGLKPNTRLELRNLGTMLAMCYSGMGYMLCPETFITRSCYTFSKEHIIYPFPHHKPMLISINYPESKGDLTIVKTFAKITQEVLAK